jgi:hypothetical protein
MLDDSVAETALDLPPTSRITSPDTAPPEPASGLRRRDLEGYSLETLSAILDP